MAVETVQSLPPAGSEKSEKAKLPLKRPMRGFATVEFIPDGSFNIGVLNHVRAVKGKYEGSIDGIPQALRILAREVGVQKVVAAAIVKDEHEDPDQEYQQKGDTIRAFNGQHDIVPLFISTSQIRAGHEASDNIDDRLVSFSRYASSKFNTYGSEKVEPDPATRRVHTLETVTLEESEKKYPEKFWRESMDIINESAKELDDSIVIRINTTAKAGGVAGMNIPMDAWIKAYNANEKRKLKKGEEGHPIDFRWYVLDRYIDPEIAKEFGINLKDPELLERYGDPNAPEKGLDIFKLTKKRHNLIQGVAKPEEDYDDLDDRLYHAWGKSQYVHKLHELRSLLQESKNNPKAKKLKIIEDDQQAFVLNEHIYAENPDAVQAGRSHIQYTDGPKAKKVADHVLEDLTGAGRKIDAFISHRSRDEQMDEFLPKDSTGQVDSRIADITMYKVATADQLGELERHMDAELARPYIQDINAHLQETGQKPITKKDVEAGFVGQFARFDPAKNHEGSLEIAFLRMERMHNAGVPLDEIPGKLTNGFGATDDTDGEWMEAKCRALVKEKHLKLKEKDLVALIDKIRIIKFDYAKFSGHHMNVLQRLCVLGEQLSTAEGCEDKITQLLQMNIPVLVADVGGMPPQIIDGKTGIKIKNPKDYESIAKIEADLLIERWHKKKYPEAHTGPTKLEQMSANTKTMVNLEYTTLANVRDILGLAAVLNNPERVPAMVREQREAKGGQFPFVKDIVMTEHFRRLQEKQKKSREQVIYAATSAVS